MHRSDASPVATTATEPRRHRRHSSACTPWPGKSWRRPKCRLYARGVSVMRAAALYPTATLGILATPTDSLSTIPSFTSASSFTLLWSSSALFYASLSVQPRLHSRLLPALPRAASSLSPRHILMKNLRRDKLLFAWRGKAREMPVRM